MNQQTRVYPYPLVAGSARPNPKMGAPDPENPLFVGFSVLRGGLRPWSQTMVSEGPDHGVGVDPETVNENKHKYPDPPILAIFDFLAFSVFRFPLLFWAFFLSFPRLLGVPRREKPLFLLGEKPLLFPKKQGLEGQGCSKFATAQ